MVKEEADRIGTGSEVVGPIDVDWRDGKMIATVGIEGRDRPLLAVAVCDRLRLA